MIRPAKPSDKPSILTYAKTGAALYPKLKFDMDKTSALATEIISSPQHFCHVVDIEGEVKGVIVGLSNDNLWAQRKFCAIPLWAADHPTGGSALLRELVKWVKSRRAIKVAGFAPDTELDARVWNIVTRAGFVKTGGSYLLYN